METKQVSSPDAIDGAVYELVELPIVQSKSGEPLVLRLGGAPIEALIEFYKSFPRLGKSALEPPAEDAPEADRFAWVDDIETHARKLAGLGCSSEPAISFEDAVAPNEITWKSLHVQNRTRIVVAWVNLSGLGQANPRLERVSSFPAGESGGGTVRAVPGGAVSDNGLAAA